MTWQAPSSWGSWTAVGYTIQWKYSTGAATSFETVRINAVVHFPGTSDTSFEFTGAQQVRGGGTPVTVTNGTSYDLRIKADAQEPGTDGSSPSHLLASSWVTVSNNVPTPPPAAPTNLQITPGDGNLRIDWTAPSGTRTGYDFHFTSATTTTLANSAASTSSNPDDAATALGGRRPTSPPLPAGPSALAPGACSARRRVADGACGGIMGARVGRRVLVGRPIRWDLRHGLMRPRGLTYAVSRSACSGVYYARR